jgi:hypothetical protein
LLALAKLDRDPTRAAIDAALGAALGQIDANKRDDPVFVSL